MHASSGVDKAHSSIWSQREGISTTYVLVRCKSIAGFPFLILPVLFILHILFIYVGGLDVVCRTIVAGQATSLDHTSHGLLSVMHELTSRANRSEPSRGLTAFGETDWTKRMTNFAPYG